MMKFKEKNAPARTEKVEQCMSAMKNNIFGLKNLYLKSELHIFSFDKAQKWPILTL